jgi:hypothetical protein
LRQNLDLAGFTDELGKPFDGYPGFTRTAKPLRRTVTHDSVTGGLDIVNVGYDDVTGAVVRHWEQSYKTPKTMERWAARLANEVFAKQCKGQFDDGMQPTARRDASGVKDVPYRHHPAMRLGFRLGHGLPGFAKDRVASTAPAK